MNPRKLFNVILKIFGLFFLREIINTIPQLVTSIFRYFVSSDAGPIIVTFLVSIFILSLYTLLVMQLLFKTNKFIDMLKLDQGFSEEALSSDNPDEFVKGISSTAILTIALIVIGGVILTDEIPNFCRQLYVYFSQSSSKYNSVKRDSSYMIFSAAKIIIGLLFLGERKRIVDFIENRTTDSADEIIEE
ncbi:hypothetical protein QWZ08_17365 [Ferruginibacter paludis]|uniref:hypothetical protein n=1 Tax=Ferruginibacter paludis TaxID=1310417 RepID=UPI0025B5F9D5|nr:hypothetical protein [Ferruginibacter paludis]MDN3657425.1 hypothetical protein [Ferruginibacter paludis]